MCKQPKSQSHTRPRPDLSPYFSNQPLGHARQVGWDCLLHAFRACVRSRIPTQDTFIANCVTLGFVDAAERQRSGFSTEMLRKWLAAHMSGIVLKKMKRLNFARVSLKSFLYFTWTHCVNQDPTLVHECLSKPGVYLVICEIIIDSVESRHCIAIDTVHQQVSDSLVDHLQRFEPSTFWKKDSITSIRNVAQIWQVMIKESDWLKWAHELHNILDHVFFPNLRLFNLFAMIFLRAPRIPQTWTSLFCRAAVLQVIDLCLRAPPSPTTRPSLYTNQTIFIYLFSSLSGALKTTSVSYFLSSVADEWPSEPVS